MKGTMDNPYQAPAHSEVQSFSGEDRYASRWQRFAAAMIDSILGIGITFGITSFGMGKPLFSHPPPTFTLTEQIVLAVVGLAAYLALHGVLLHRRGQTIGKMMVGIRIVDQDSGRLVPLKRILLLRVLPLTAVAHIPLIGTYIVTGECLAIFFTKRRQCVHDLIARTVVERVPSPAVAVEAIVA